MKSIANESTVIYVMIWRTPMLSERSEQETCEVVDHGANHMHFGEVIMLLIWCGDVVIYAKCLGVGISE